MVGSLLGRYGALFLGISQVRRSVLAANNQPYEGARGKMTTREEITRGVLDAAKLVVTFVGGVLLARWFRRR